MRTPSTRAAMPTQVTQAVASKHGFSIAKDFGGHGVGPDFHMQPTILHMENKEPGVMQVGVKGVGQACSSNVRVRSKLCRRAVHAALRVEQRRAPAHSFRAVPGCCSGCGLLQSLLGRDLIHVSLAVQHARPTYPAGWAHIHNRAYLVTGEG